MKPRHLPRPRRVRGFGLIDALIALAILAFGMLGMTRLQARVLAQATEGQSRMTASQMGDELISTALVDTLNPACYTLPAAGVCGSVAARAIADDWELRTLAAMKSGSTVTSTYTAATGRLSVVITWTGKQTGDTRRLEATTDVR